MTMTGSRADWGRGLIEDYRANGEPTTGPLVGRQVLLLTTKGSKTGVDRTTPSCTPWTTIRS